MIGQREIIVSASRAGLTALLSSQVSAQNTVPFKLKIVRSALAIATIASLLSNRKQILSAFHISLLVCSFLVAGTAQGKTVPEGYFMTFDPPGSTSTMPSGITAFGVVVGSYVDSSGVQHGFLRNLAGSFTTFDPLGSVLTTATAINPEGTVTGAWNDASGVTHGFVRTPDGTITSFDAPTGQIENSIYTIDGTPPSINPAGAVAGTTFAYDPNYTEQGFFRERNGTIITIDAPGATETEVLAVNQAGMIIGDFFNATVYYQGFLRAPDGTFITTGFPGIPICINPAGTAAGNYTDANNVVHGFARAANGTVTTFGVPGSVNIEVYAINPTGTLTGYYYTNTFHGFLRAGDGTFTTFDVPDSSGTIGQAINLEGIVTGIYLDAASVYHGFLFFPGPRFGSTLMGK
jgi:hypothetical protein